MNLRIIKNWIIIFKSLPFCMIFKFINNIMFLYNFQFEFKSIFGWYENKSKLKPKLYSIWFEELKLSLYWLKSILIWVEIMMEW